MSTRFCMSFHFLDGAFHGQSDGNECEWPPSPLRVFQSLIAAAARRNGGHVPEPSQAALMWLEKQGPPEIAAPGAVIGRGYRLSVPSNQMDIVAAKWAGGNYSNVGDASPATHRTMKAVRPVLLADEVVHYLWRLDDAPSPEVEAHMRAVSEIARSVVSLGWGIDLAVCHAVVLSVTAAEMLRGERWIPMGPAGTGGLRVPKEGSLNDVLRRHGDFMTRLTPNGELLPPPPLSVYRKEDYRRPTDAPGWPVVSFALLTTDAGAYRAFDTSRRALSVAGMLRFAVRSAAEKSGWSKEQIDRFVLGHGETPEERGHLAVGPRRFAYVPLPSMEARGEGATRVAGAVRRVMLTCYASGCEAEFAWARRVLSGCELIDEATGEAGALLSLIPANEKVVRRYTQRASEWATVTPVILPGFDDPRHYRRRLERGIQAGEQKSLLERLDQRIDSLVRKAIVQAGFSPILARAAEIEWRKAGFWPGADLVDKYGVPAHLKRFPRLHVKIRWRDGEGDDLQVSGPICIGGGRYYGLGLFAAM